MLGIGETLLQGDGNCRHAEIFGSLGHALNLGVGKWCQNSTLSVYAFGYLEPVCGGHQGRQFGGHLKPVKLAPVLAANFQGIAKTFSGDQGHWCQAVLDDGIGRHCCSMHEICDIGPIYVHGSICRGDTGYRITGAALYLGSAHRAILGINGDDIGESAADIYTDFPTAGHG